MLGCMYPFRSCFSLASYLISDFYSLSYKLFLIWKSFTSYLDFFFTSTLSLLPSFCFWFLFVLLKIWSSHWPVLWLSVKACFTYFQSQIFHFLSICPWKSSFISLCLSFLICKQYCHFLMFFLSVQKLWSWIRSYLFIFAFVSFALGDRYKKILPWVMSKNVLPMFPSISFTVFSLTFRSLIHWVNFCLCEKMF